ncbi:MAG: transporter substrate-binding domain-containing protein, partial [Magnetococcus sp. WYHC-3]
PLQVTSMKDLRGRQVAVLEEVLASRRDLESVGGVNIVYARDTKEVVRLLLEGKVDAAFGSVVALREQMGESASLLRVAYMAEEFSSPAVISVRKDWPELVTLLDHVLDRMPEDEYKRIHAQWFHLGAVPRVRLRLGAEEREWIRRNPVVSVAFDADWPPVEFADSQGRHRGLAADYLEQIGQMLGMRFDGQSTVPWSEALQSVRRGERAMFSAVAPTRQRKEWLAFTAPYLSIPMVIVTRAETPFVEGLERLAGRKVAVVQGYAAHDLLIQQHPDLQIVTATDIPQGLRLLTRGQADAFVDSLAAVGGVIARERLEGLVVSGKTPYSYDISMAVPQGQSILLGLLEKGLAALDPQERLVINQRWMGVNLEAPPPDYTLMLGGGGFILLVVVVVVSWNRKLAGLNRALVQSSRAADEANRAKSMFLANMSHELRTPLHAIMGYALLLQDRRGWQQHSAEGLRIIHDSGRHLLGLINDLLELSRIEEGRLLLHPRAVNLRAFLDRVMDLVRPAALRKGLSLTLNVQEGADATLMLDEGRLRQVLLNLLGNAINNTDAGSVELRVVSQEPGAEGEGLRLVFQVHDSGCGIPAGHLDAIFAPFEQLPSERREHGGVGLGLAISRQLVRLMGGDIAVDSTPGQGSCFQFSLPVSLATLQTTEGAEPVQRSVPSLEFPGDRAPVVLVVDDHPDSLHLMVNQMRLWGADVQGAASGPLALEACQQREFSLVLLDLMMSHWDGFRTLHALRQESSAANIPVVAVTADLTEATRRRVAESGFADMLTKPVDPEALRQTMLRLLYGDMSATGGHGPVAGASADLPQAPPLSHEEWQELLDWVRLGRMRRMERWAQQREETLPKHAAFFHKVRELAGRVDESGLLPLLESAMARCNAPPPSLSKGGEADAGH